MRHHEPPVILDLMIRSSDEPFFQRRAYDSDIPSIRVNRSSLGKRVTQSQYDGPLNRSDPLLPPVNTNLRVDTSNNLDNPMVVNCSSDNFFTNNQIPIDRRSIGDEVLYNQQSSNYRGFNKSHDPGNTRSMSISPNGKKSNLYRNMDSMNPKLGFSEGYYGNNYSVLSDEFLRLSICDPHVSHSPKPHSVHSSDRIFSNQPVSIIPDYDHNYDNDNYHLTPPTLINSDNYMYSNSSNQYYSTPIYSPKASLPSGDLFTQPNNPAYGIDPNIQYSNQYDLESSKLHMHVFENDPFINTSPTRSTFPSSPFVSFPRSPDSHQFQMGGDSSIFTSTSTTDIHSSKESSDESFEKHVDKTPKETKKKRNKKNKKKQENGKQGVCNSEDVNIEKVKNGEEKRTAVMLRNLPNRFTKESLMRVLDSIVPKEYTIINMPLDPKTKRNLGYIFIHFHSSDVLIKAYTELQGKTWPNSESLKTIRFCYAKIQDVD